MYLNFLVNRIMVREIVIDFDYEGFDLQKKKILPPHIYSSYISTVIFLLVDKLINRNCYFVAKTH